MDANVGEEFPKILVRHLKAEDVIKEASDGITDFSDIVSVCADFKGKTLSGLNFSRAKMAKTDFSGAIIKNCNFKGAELSDTNFKNAKIENTSFEEALLLYSDFSGANITTTTFRNANLKSSDFKSAKIIGSVIDLADTGPKSAEVVDTKFVLDEYKKGRRDFTGITIKEADFSGKTIPGIILANAVLRNAAFDFADLNGANFENADLSNSRFHGSKLEKANFKKANMYLSYINAAFFEETDFSETILLWAKLEGINMALAKIEGTIFSWVLMKDVKMTPSQFLSLPPEVLETIKMENTEAPIPAQSSTPSLKYGGTADKYASGPPTNKYTLPDNLYIVSTAADTYKSLRNLYGK